MPEITWKEAKKGNSSRSRRRKRREEEREAESKEANLIRNLSTLISGTSGAVLKAMDLPGEDRELCPDEDGGGDAMNKVVNHAHQRNPKKKW